MKTEIKSKTKKLLAQILITSTFFLGLIYVCEQSIIKMTVFWTDFLVMHTDSFEIKIKQVKAEEELSVRDYVRMEIEKAGLDWKEIDCLIFHESSWNPNGWLINKDGKSVDQGLWAINSYWHREVSHVCNFDFRCQTKEAIRIIKANGNLNAWVGWRNNCR